MIFSAVSRAPAAMGTKAIEIVQLAETVTLAQSCVAAKSPNGLVIDDTANAALPVLVTVTACTGPETPTLVGTKPANERASVNAGVAGGLPVPVRLRYSGLPITLEATFSWPLNVAADGGSNA